jgi:hypothetical protein
MDEQSKVIDGVLKLVEELGYVPTTREYKALEHEGKPSFKAIKRLFGSWNDMLKEAGLPIKREMPKLSEEAVLAAISSFVAQYRRPPTLADYRDKLVGVDAETVIARFGSINKALEELELRSRYGQGADYEEIKTHLRQLATELGRTPTRNEFEERYKITVYRGVHSWVELVKAAGLSPVRDTPRRKK